MGNDDSARRLGLLAVAAGLALALAAAGKRLAQARNPVADTYCCGCGAAYRVSGADRHRVYWHDGEPVLGDRCVACDVPLPSGHDGVVV